MYNSLEKKPSQMCKMMLGCAFRAWERQINAKLFDVKIFKVFDTDIHQFYPELMLLVSQAIWQSYQKDQLGISKWCYKHRKDRFKKTLHKIKRILECD